MRGRLLGRRRALRIWQAGRHEGCRRRCRLRRHPPRLDCPLPGYRFVARLTLSPRDVVDILPTLCRVASNSVADEVESAAPDGERSDQRRDDAVVGRVPGHDRLHLALHLSRSAGGWSGAAGDLVGPAWRSAARRIWRLPKRQS